MKKVFSPFNEAGSEELEESRLRGWNRNTDSLVETATALQRYSSREAISDRKNILILYIYIYNIKFSFDFSLTEFLTVAL